MGFDHRLRAGTLLLAVMLLVAACGGGDDTDDGGGAPDSAQTEAATPAADADDAADADADAGGAADADGDDAGTTDAGGEGFTVGYSLPTGQNPWLNAIKDAAVAVIESAGGSVVVQDAQLDPNRQVSQLDELVNQGVDAIVLGPAQVPEAVQGALEGAQAAGIPTLALEYDYDVTDEPPPAPMDAQVLVDRRELARQVAAEVAGGSVVYVGLPFPVTGLDVFFAAFEEALEAEGATLLERVDNPTDNAEGARPLIDAVLARHTDLTAIVTYNGPSALGAYQALESAGREGDVAVHTIQLEEVTVDAQREGRIALQWELPPDLLGGALGEMATAAATGQDDSWRRTETVGVVPFDQTTIGDWQPWTDRLEALAG